ncbi:MAG: GerMN domain-containing protein [Desulfobacteraceae bacterium]
MPVIHNIYIQNKRVMGRRWHAILLSTLFGSAILIAVGLGWMLANRSGEQLGDVPSGPGYGPRAVEKSEIHLYFGDDQGRYLTAEQRIVDRPGDAVAFGRQILAVLLAGPKQGASRTLPKGAALRAFHILSNGVAYVDFESGSFDDHPKGVATELLSIYSIVNSLVLNVEEIRTVKFLIGGQEAATLAGHVDMSHPFKADMLWVR